MAKLARWQPITEVERWFDRFDRLFDRMLTRFFRDLERDFWGLDWWRERWVPAMEVSETPDAYIVRVELPGVKTEDIEVTLQDDILTSRASGSGARSARMKPSTLWSAPTANSSGRSASRPMSRWMPLRHPTKMASWRFACPRVKKASPAALR